MGVVQQFRHIVDRSHRRAALRKFFDNLIAGPRCDPSRHHLIEFGGVFDTVMVGEKTFIRDQVGPPDSPHQPLENRLGACRQGYPAPVGSSVSVARGR